MMDRTILDKIDRINRANTAYLFYLYRKYRLQIVAFSSHIAFIRTCIRENLTPHFLNYHLYSDNHFISTKLHKLIRKKWLQYEVNRWYGRMNTTTHLISMIHQKLAIRLLDFELYQLLTETDDICNFERKKLLRKKSKKLDTLRNELSVADQLPPITFYPRLSNLTDVNFSEEKTRYLEKGLNFSIFR